MTDAGGPTRRRPVARTSGPDATLRQGARPILYLYRCPRFSAWLTVNACAALRTSDGPRGPEHRYAREQEQPRELHPCSGCPGVLELRARGETPAPRRLAT